MNEAAISLLVEPGCRVLRPKQLDYEFFDREKALRSVIKTTRPLILDVGANVGQSVEWFKERWPDAVIHSFEPQGEEFEQLSALAKRYADVTCANAALGDIIGTAKFIRNEAYPAASSFFAVRSDSEAVASDVHPKAKFGETEYASLYVPIDTIDNYARIADINHIDLIKIDVQGYEPEVLRGAKRSMSDGKIGAILVEIMFDDVYERTPSFYDVEHEIREFGFRLYDITHIYKDLNRGRTHWVDALYVRLAECSESHGLADPAKA